MPASTDLNHVVLEAGAQAGLEEGRGSCSGVGWSCWALRWLWESLHSEVFSLLCIEQMILWLQSGRVLPVPTLCKSLLRLHRSERRLRPSCPGQGYAAIMFVMHFYCCCWRSEGRAQRELPVGHSPPGACSSRTETAHFSPLLGLYGRHMELPKAIQVLCHTHRRCQCLQV